MPMRLAAATLIAIVASAAAPPTHRYKLDAANSDVAAKVAFFGLASKTAHFPKLRGEIVLDPVHPQAANLEVELDARALTAPDEVTLARLKSRNFFWVERYPVVRFVGRGLRLSGPRSGAIAGEITARGVTRPATLSITFAHSVAVEGPRQPIELTGRTTIDRRSFGMTAYPLIIGRKVAITIRARMVPA
jgi:polyisoprenoid-binding protein YceI